MSRDIRCEHSFVLNRVKCPHGCTLANYGFRSTLPARKPRMPQTEAARATVEALEKQINGGRLVAVRRSA